ncbi:DEAD/DEAH box helicase [Shewanella algae]|uniref:DEAD/DEAH box helicase n=1 Tax=Shewanella algae TaxID=38313 RepID=UPI0031F4A69A
MSFASLGLSAPILNAVAEQGYSTPSPIQAQAIPAVLQGRDVMAAAQTGTGKTAGFTLPLLERLNGGIRPRGNHIRALVLTPTRELAAQVAESVSLYGKHLDLRSSVVFGGVSINPQMQTLRKGVDILVATPGRLLDLYQQNAIKFGQLEVLVLDEADRMLDMGFIHDIKKILALLPAKRQNLMFSATFSDDIRRLAKGLVHDPAEISVAPANSTAELVSQKLHPVDKSKKSALLTSLIKEYKWQQVLVFTRTKHGANRLAKHLDGKGIGAAAIHGNKSQGARTKALADFKSGKVKVLVATDIAARGLDIDQLPQVVNFDLPNVAEDYVHRIGRTGRAGASGQAVSLVSAEEFKQLKDIEQLIGKTIEREIVNGFEPQEALPESRLNPNKIGPKKPKKPKKPKEGHQDGQRSGNLDKGNGNKPANAENRHRRPAQGAKTEGSSARRKPANAKPQGGRSQESKPQGAGKGNSGSGQQRNNQGRTSQQRDSQARGSRQRNER